MALAWHRLTRDVLRSQTVNHHSRRGVPTLILKFPVADVLRHLSPERKENVPAVSFSAGIVPLVLSHSRSNPPLIKVQLYGTSLPCLCGLNTSGQGRVGSSAWYLKAEGRC